MQGGDSAPTQKKVETLTVTPVKTSALTRAFSILLPVLLLLIAIALNLYGGK